MLKCLFHVQSRELSVPLICVDAQDEGSLGQTIPRPFIPLDKSDKDDRAGGGGGREMGKVGRRLGKRSKENSQNDGC